MYKIFLLSVLFTSRVYGADEFVIDEEFRACRNPYYVVDKDGSVYAGSVFEAEKTRRELYVQYKKIESLPLEETDKEIKLKTIKEMIVKVSGLICACKEKQD